MMMGFLNPLYIFLKYVVRVGTLGYGFEIIFFSEWIQMACLELIFSLNSYESRCVKYMVTSLFFWNAT